jgi:hypothetical protein
MGLAVIWAVYSERTVGVAALILVPLTASALQELVPRGPSIQRRELLGVLAMAAAACALMSIRLPEARSNPLPAWVDAELDARPQGTRLLNEWSTGSYLLWRHPDLSVLMHGYGEVFTPAELERNAGIMRLDGGWDADVEKVDPDLALVDPGSSLGYALLEDPGWRVVRQDARFALLEPAPASTAS